MTAQLKFGVLALLESTAGKADELAAFLEAGRALAAAEPGTVTWYAFRLGENIACTPGKVVHRTELYELIQYSPATAEVLETPLVIFPPWINRFYILDLNPKKSFVQWCVGQGVSVFIVSWRRKCPTTPGSIRMVANTP